MGPTEALEPWVEAMLPLGESEAFVAGALHELEPRDASELLEALLDRLHDEATASSEPWVVRTEGALLAGATWLVARLDPATAEGWRRVLLARGLAGLLA